MRAFTGADSFPYEVPVDLLSALESADSVLLATHENPDPDGMGSLVALGLALQERGRRVARVDVGPLPRVFEALPGLDRIDVADPAQRFDLGLLFDAHLRSRTGDAAETLAAAGRVFAIDHHPPGPDGSDCDAAWILPEAPATTMLVLSILHEMHDVPLGADKASCLYAGLLTDTGGFRHANTTHDALLAAADLVGHGADPAALAERLLHRRRPQALRLRAAALMRTEYRLGGAVAIMVVDEKLLEETGGTMEETEGLVSELTGIEGVRIGVLMKQVAPDAWRVSLRSAGNVRVDEVARSFGGGGHLRAAAFSADGRDRDAIEEDLLVGLTRAFDGAGGGR